MLLYDLCKQCEASQRYLLSSYLLLADYYMPVSEESK